MLTPDRGTKSPCCESGRDYVRKYGPGPSDWCVWSWDYRSESRDIRFCPFCGVELGTQGVGSGPDKGPVQTTVVYRVPKGNTDYWGLVEETVRTEFVGTVNKTDKGVTDDKPRPS